jgi:hypothetical protein
VSSFHTVLLSIEVAELTEPWLVERGPGVICGMYAIKSRDISLDAGQDAAQRNGLTRERAHLRIESKAVE